MKNVPAGFSKIDDTNFTREVLMCPLDTVLVYFWGGSCPKCKAMLPVIEGLKDSFGDAVKFAEFNTGGNLEIPRDYGIRSLPTVMIFQHGSTVGQVSGEVQEQEIAAVLSDLTSLSAASRLSRVWAGDKAKGI
jgi:thioredoxin 1